MQIDATAKRIRVRRWILILFSGLLASCAGVEVSPEMQCPQPRFTGKAPESIYNLVNPLSFSDESISNGRAIYESQAQPPCRLCHGIKGDGQGPLATQFAVPPRNFSCAETVNGIPDGQLFWIIQNGSPGTSMPGFNHLNDKQIWELVTYLRQLAIM
ncbi:MAG: cytochrome c [Gammaproteobacteria bacterium]|nr:cytochrome c [Gammaproteobacteria bacterium]